MATKNYYVYHLPPSHPTSLITTPCPTATTNTGWHYGFYLTTLSTESLPDIRFYQPKWIYNSTTKAYTDITPDQLWVRPTQEVCNSTVGGYIDTQLCVPGPGPGPAQKILIQQLPAQQVVAQAVCNTTAPKPQPCTCAHTEVPTPTSTQQAPAQMFYNINNNIVVSPYHRKTRKSHHVQKVPAQEMPVYGNTQIQSPQMCVQPAQQVLAQGLCNSECATKGCLTTVHVHKHTEYGRWKLLKGKDRSKKHSSTIATVFGSSTWN